MSAPSFTIRHLCFTGPEKQPALLTFEIGLNVLYGASETGKSFVLESINFMLGGKDPLRDIPERVGYDQISLGIAVEGGSNFTLIRSTSGGSFRVLQGLHQSSLNEESGEVLLEKYSAENENNISTFLLKKIGLAGKKVKKNSRGITQNLSFRNLCRLCLITEGDIQKEGSPIEKGQYTEKTAEYSIFKLLLTGVDDSSLVLMNRSKSLSESNKAKLEFIDELIATYRFKLSNQTEDPESLSKKLEELDSSLIQEQIVLTKLESEYQSLVTNKNESINKLDKGIQRRSEIDELIARFTLLDEHYQSDLARLEGIREAGSLIAAIAPVSCPLCGTAPEQQHRTDNCDGNVDIVVSAVESESSKIIRLRRELQETIQQLNSEAESFDRIIPKIRIEIDNLLNEINKLAPCLTEKRMTYSEFVEHRSSIRSSIDLVDQIKDLEDRRQILEQDPNDESNAIPTSTDLSSTVLDQFSQKTESVLKSWNFPDSDRVHFDETTRDLVISGKKRGSRGKGMRAITHAAFTVGLLEFCKEEGRFHPGFIVMDSPLLAYREPEGIEDDLTKTDVQDKFYQYLEGWTDRQIIVIENIDPPPVIKSRKTSIMFSKNPNQGRYGFFPNQSPMS